MKQSRAFPMAFALARSKTGSPVLVAVPLKPNIFSARRPTKGAAQAAIAPSKHLQTDPGPNLNALEKVPNKCIWRSQEAVEPSLASVPKS
jgi:hypothetical protein